MGRLFTLLVVVAVIVWIVRRSGLLAGRAGGGSGPLGGRPIFRARFEDGELVEADGVLPAPLRIEIAELALRERLTGEVSLGAGERIAFSSSIPPGTRQRLRNVLVNTR